MKQVVKDRSDIVFYLKVAPIVQLHPDAYKKSQAILCEKSNEKALALLEDAYDKKPLPEPTCKTDQVDKNIQLMKSMGVNGTPTMILQSGKKLSGAMDASKLVEMILKQ